MSRATYTLTIAAVPDRLGREPHIRLRLALKYLLRACNFKCLTIQHNDPNLRDAIAEERATAPTTPNAIGCEPREPRGIPVLDVTDAKPSGSSPGP